MIDRCSLGTDGDFPKIRLAAEHAALRIIDDITQGQHTGMVVIRDIEARDFASVFPNPSENPFPAVAIPVQFGNRLKGPAALTGHLAPDAHVLAAVIVNIDAAEKLLCAIPMSATAVNPRNPRQAKTGHDLFDIQGFTGKAEPVIQDDVFLFGTFCTIHQKTPFFDMIVGSDPLLAGGSRRRERPSGNYQVVS